MRSFHSALNATVSGVTVVTTRVGGRPLGQTVTTLTSLSDESPLLLVAVSGEFAAAVTERGAFAVNVLGDTRPRSPRRSAASRRSSPTVTGGRSAAARSPACTARRRGSSAASSAWSPAGERVLVIGAVTRAARGTAGPLAYVRRGYAAPLAA